MKTVTSRRSIGNNARRIKRRVTNKGSAGRNKNMNKKKKRKMIFSLKRYITKSSFFEMMHSCAIINNQQGNEEFVVDSVSTLHMVNSLKYMTNLWEVKIESKTGNKKKLTGYLSGDCKRYQKIYVRFYPVMCTDTTYIPDLSVNIFSVMHVLTKGFNVTSEK